MSLWVGFDNFYPPSGYMEISKLFRGKYCDKSTLYKQKVMPMSRKQREIGVFRKSS